MKAAHNPFRASAIAKIRYRIAQSERETLLAHWMNQARQGCLLGPRGSGKTTLLEDLESTLRERGFQPRWIRLSEESTDQQKNTAITQLQSFTMSDVCFFDGAEVLNWWQWRKVRSYANKFQFGLIATLHRPRKLAVLKETHTDWELTCALVEQLLESTMSDALLKTARQAFDASDGNMREVFRACYLALAHNNPSESEKRACNNLNLS